MAALIERGRAAGDHAAALGLAANAGRRPDLGAEKIVSHRYRFVWICTPKAASRSIIAALRAADPGALLIEGRSLDRVLARHPEARGYFRFAFLRDPRARILSFWADKHGLARRDRDNRRWFIEPWHGVSLGMDFAAFCRWLATPCGSDAYADRHWLSQARQVADADGRLPDFLGRWETLEADWRWVTGRLGLPAARLPHLNAGPGRPGRAAALDAGAVALLERRYAADFRLGGYGADRAGAGNG